MALLPLSTRSLHSFIRAHTLIRINARTSSVCVRVHSQESVRAKVRTALAKTLPQELAVRLENSPTDT